MEDYTFIKYFPDTKLIIKYHMTESYDHIEEISLYQQYQREDPNFKIIRNGGKWFEIYMPLLYVAKTSRDNLRISCDVLNNSTLPKEALFAIVYENHNVSIIWPNQVSIKEKYLDFVQKYVGTSEIREL
jgi:hypothetical protein